MPKGKGYKTKVPKVKPLVKRNINIKDIGDKTVRRIVKKGKKLGFDF